MIVPAQDVGVERPTVIVLNGAGSVGKTSTSKELQRIARRPFLHVAMDSFLDMLPIGMFGDPAGYIFETTDDGGRPSVVIHSGPVLARLMNGMRHAVAAMAEQGNNLVVDDVMFNGGEVDEYRRLLESFDARIVGLFAPLEILEQRERERGDRAIGLARWQHERVHSGARYDLEIDTALLTPAQVAVKICEAFRL